MSISQDQKAIVIDKPSLEYICSCIKLLQSVPVLLNDLTPSQKTVYSSYKVTELLNTLNTDLQTYVNTSLGALTHLKKEIVQTVPTVDTAEENTIYLLKNDEDGGYSQYLLINGVVENLGSTTAVINAYTKTETDAKFALLSTLNDLIATVGGLNELKTNTKESIVKAINELNDRNYLEVLEITDTSVLDYAKTFDILTHNYFYANNCVDLPNNEHYGYCSVEVSQDPLYRDITFYSPTDGRIYVNTIGANADGSDYGTWSGWHKHLTNDDIVDVIDGNSTDDQIPSALAVKTELDKKFNNADLDNLEQGTLVTETSMNKNILLWDVGHYYFNSNVTWRTYEHIPSTEYAPHVYVTSVKPVKYEDTKNVGTWFRQIKVDDHLGKSFIRTIYTDNVKNVVDLENGKILPDGHQCKDTGWQRICTTSVADVPKTQIVFSDTTYYEVYNPGGTTYEVVNGICYLQADVKVKNQFLSYSKVLDGIPIPKTQQNGMASPWNYNNTNANLLFKISNGALFLAYGEPSQHHLINIAYPVENS